MTDPEKIATIKTRLAIVRERIATACAKVNRKPEEVTLVAVTKTLSPSAAALLPPLGLNNLGENRPQQLWLKAAAIPFIRWHFIGHMQRNKLDKTLPLVSLFHSVDNLRLLEAINALGLKSQRKIQLLLEVNCSGEENKGGFAPADIPALCDSLQLLANVDVKGFMTMAAFHEDPELCRPTFQQLRTIRDEAQERLKRPLPWLSMGMSNDYQIAIEEGATHIRLGTTLFEGLQDEPEDA